MAAPRIGGEVLADDHGHLGVVGSLRRGAPDGAAAVQHVGNCLSTSPTWLRRNDPGALLSRIICRDRGDPIAPLLELGRNLAPQAAMPARIQYRHGNGGAIGSGLAVQLL